VNSVTSKASQSGHSDHQKTTETPVPGSVPRSLRATTKWLVAKPTAVQQIGSWIAEIVKLFTNPAAVNGLLLLSGNLEPHFVSLLLIISNQRYLSFHSGIGIVKKVVN
jgi:hypothetical protein